METFVNPMTGQAMPLTISSLTKLRLEVKSYIKNLESAVNDIDDVLMGLLEEEGGAFELDNYFVKIQQNNRKVFDVDKVVDLLDGQLRYTNEEGEVVEFYQPKVTAIRNYLGMKVEAGELPQEKADLYKSSFYEKPSKPFVKITEK